jgi:hypothetical protein
MFKSSYDVFGRTVVCNVIQTTVRLKNERPETYNYLKKLTRKYGWKYYQIETLSQDGFPDILILRDDEYWMIEVKYLKRKTLKSIADDLEWQFGQLAVLNRSIVANLNYMLCVAKGDTLAFIKGKTNAQTNVSDYPDFTG